MMSKKLDAIKAELEELKSTQELLAPDDVYVSSRVDKILKMVEDFKCFPDLEEKEKQTTFG